MPRMTLPDAPFLIDALTALTDQDLPVFDGFAFAGADMIIGAASLADWQAENGPLPLLSDGTYILARQTAEGLQISADGAGYRHLFYWQGGSDWAVGESLVGLVAQLRGRNIPLRENPAQMAALLSRRQVFQQLTTRQTPVQGIRVLGRDEVLMATKTGLHVARHPRPVADDYPAALHAFLNTWLSRCLSLHHGPGLRLFYHLSGGVDSRAVASFRVYLERQFDLPANGDFKSLEDAAHASDHEVSQRIAQATGLALNTLEHRAATPLSNASALADWERVSLGAYSPARLVPRRSPPAEINLTGHGGGGFKTPMSRLGMAQLRWIMGRDFGRFAQVRPEAKAAFMADLTDEFAHLGQITDEPGQIYNLFGRASRARFHGGQAASYKTQVAPFDSRLAETAADSRPASAQRPLQFHFDILASLAPDLLDIPFDKRRKAPSRANLRALTRAERLAPEPGRVFGRFSPRPDETLSDGAPIRDLLEQIRAAWADLPQHRLNRKFFEIFEAVAADIEAGKRPPPTKLRPLHHAWLLIRLARLGVAFAD